MSTKWIYGFAVFLLLLLRIVVLSTHLDASFAAMHMDGLASFIASLRASPYFVHYLGNWGLPVFVIAVFVFWMTDSEDGDISKQFLLLPIAYVPFAIVGTVLATAEFQLSYLYVYPLVILPFGYAYVSLWVLLVWLLGKCGVVH